MKVAKFNRKTLEETENAVSDIARDWKDATKLDISVGL